ncbi:MAG: hypothetical protein ABSF64_01795 [Bryobacteraceae bacterium]|jgi:hypothetical protein
MAKEYIERHDENHYVAATRISLDSIVNAFGVPNPLQPSARISTFRGLWRIAYHLANQADIDAYLARQSDKRAAGKRSVEPLPANLREKLMRAREEMHTSRVP